MKNFCLLKREILKKWIKGLQICSSSSKNMGILERKNAIKLSADLAMALARKGRTSWSRAIIAKASSGNNIINDNTKKASINLSSTNDNNMMMRMFRSRKIMKRSHNIRRALIRKSHQYYHDHQQKKVVSKSLAKRLVEKKTQVLKRLVPGGDQCLDEVSLIKETLDYIVSLTAQVDVMRCTLASATADN